MICLHLSHSVLSAYLPLMGDARTPEHWHVPCSARSSLFNPPKMYAVWPAFPRRVSPNGPGSNGSHTHVGSARSKLRNNTPPTIFACLLIASRTSITSYSTRSNQNWIVDAD